MKITNERERPGSRRKVCRYSVLPNISQQQKNTQKYQNTAEVHPLKAQDTGDCLHLLSFLALSLQWWLRCDEWTVSGQVYVHRFLWPVQRGTAQNEDKGLSWDRLVILAEFSHKSVTWKQIKLYTPSYHGDLFCGASLLQTRLKLILEIHLYFHRKSCEELMCFTVCPWSFQVCCIILIILH